MKENSRKLEKSITQQRFKSLISHTEKDIINAKRIKNLKDLSKNIKIVRADVKKFSVNQNQTSITLKSLTI